MGCLSITEYEKGHYTDRYYENRVVVSMMIDNITIILIHDKRNNKRIKVFERMYLFRC